MSNRPLLVLSSDSFANTPLSVDDLMFWSDGSDIAYFNPAAIGDITSILDKSGNGYDTDSQSTGTKRADLLANQLNGRSVISCDGGDAYKLNTALHSIPNGSNTMFVVAKTNSNSTQQRIINMTAAFSSDYGLEFSSNVGQAVFFNNPSGAGVGVTGLTETDWNILKARRSGTTVAISANGGTEVTNTNGADVSNINDATLFSYDESSLFLDGHVAEIIIYNRSLSDAESSIIENYLSNKWGIALV